MGAASKWGKSAAKVLMGRTLAEDKGGVKALREALAAKMHSVIARFRELDSDGDQRISRREFARALPRLDLGIKFELADADELFNTIDKDKSGWINYHELERALRNEGRHAATPEQAKLAHNLLAKTEVMVVLGASTRAKKAFCTRLAYIFNGTWISVRTLAEREMHTFGSKAAGEIRRKLEADQPIPFGLLRSCLDSAVHGRGGDNGQMAPLRGPFFLYDLPRSVRELEQLDSRFSMAPTHLHFEQRSFDESSNGAMHTKDHEELVARLKQRGTLVTLDAEKEVKHVVDTVVRHLRVKSTERQLRRAEERRGTESRLREVHGKQRAYVQATSRVMAAALRDSLASTARADSARADRVRQFYIEPSGTQQRVMDARRCRLEELDQIRPEPTSLVEPLPPATFSKGNATALSSARVSASLPSSPRLVATAPSPGAQSARMAPRDAQKLAASIYGVQPPWGDISFARIKRGALPRELRPLGSAGGGADALKAAPLAAAPAPLQPIEPAPAPAEEQEAATCAE
jgi:hypothetical protein